MEFVELYQQNEAALQNFAYKLTHNRSGAKDLVQETALKAFRAFRNFRKGTSFKSWTFTILKNTFISDYRKRMRRPTIHNEPADVEFALKQHTENKALSTFQVNYINQSMQLLSYKSRMPLELYIQGYQYNEIADMLNIPIGTVKSRINYGRTKMKKILNGFKKPVSQFFNLKILI